ncbi:hypothetical protein F1880_003278 [Penicillium rolfsii]|nr:hypothetical protein F1880_003278 [Penicillium rolfsii]
MTIGNPPGDLPEEPYVFRMAFYMQISENQHIHRPPAIPDKKRPTPAKFTVARPKAPAKTKPTQRHEADGAVDEARVFLPVDCFKTSHDSGSLHSTTRIILQMSLRNVMNAFHMCRSVKLHAAMADWRPKIRWPGDTLKLSRAH